MNKLRTSVLIIGIALTFIIIAALAIIIARGDKLTNDGKLVQTGIVKIRSKPEDAVVYVDGKETKLQDKQIIGLDAGEHDIILKKEGYTDWNKKVEARSGTVVEIYAQLFPKSLNLNDSTKTNIDRLFYSQDGDWAVYAVKNSEVSSDIGLWRIRLSKPTISLIEIKPVKLTNVNPILSEILNSKYDIEFSPDARLLKIHNIDKNEYYILDAQIYNEPNTSLNANLGFAPDAVYWFRESNSLVIVKNDLAFEYEFDTKKSTIISLIPEQKPIIAVNKNKVIYYNQGKSRLEFYERGKSDLFEVPNLTLPNNIKSLYLTKNDHKFLVFETDKGFFYLNSEKGFLNKIAEGINLLSFSPDGQSVLYTKDGNLYSYIVKQFISENTFVTKSSLIETTFNIENENAKWSPDSIHIIITKITPEIKSIRICDRDGANTKEIINNPSIINFDTYISSDSSLLYLLMSDEINENQVPLTSRKNLYEIDLINPSSN